jgi:hypothetical protein
MELEAVIERGLASFLETGRALCAVRDGKLYLPHYNSFEEYCALRWRICLRHSRRLIGAVKIWENLNAAESGSDCALPSSEKTLRPLASIEPPLQVAVWRLATRISPEPDSRVIGRIVRVVRGAIEQGTDGTNGSTLCPRSTSGKGPQQISSKAQVEAFHQLAASRISPYFMVEHLRENDARRLFSSCQRLIVLSHECIESIRTRFPAI